LPRQAGNHSATRRSELKDQTFKNEMSDRNGMNVRNEASAATSDRRPVTSR